MTKNSQVKFEMLVENQTQLGSLAYFKESTEKTLTVDGPIEVYKVKVHSSSAILMSRNFKSRV